VVAKRARQDPDVRHRIEHDGRAPARARQVVTDLLGDPDDVIGDDVRLATSELVTNVVNHTANGGELRVWDPQPDVPLHLEVEDTDTHIPAIPTDPPEAGGRGLAIVQSVAEDWGIEQLPEGKVVWAEFDRNRRTDGGAPDRPPDATTDDS
jgi:anti-sigma regulatory factor (Ser/Thr protein kinase)